MTAMPRRNTPGYRDDRQWSAIKLGDIEIQLLHPARPSRYPLLVVGSCR